MRYLALKAQHALETLEAIRRGEKVNDDVVEVRGSGDGTEVENGIEKLISKLNEIKRRYPEKLKPRDPVGGKFEAEACREIHQALPFDPVMLADYEWWTWLAVFRFRELVDWRYGSGNAEAAAANFGIGNGGENLLYRMWLRADIGYDPKREDPYELARCGGQDFWRSHVFRQSYGRCRALVRALIIYQFPQGPEGEPTLTIDQMRELAKRLRRIHTNIVFEYLDENCALELVRSEAELAKEAVRPKVVGI